MKDVSRTVSKGTMHRPGEIGVGSWLVIISPSPDCVTTTITRRLDGKGHRQEFLVESREWISKLTSLELADQTATCAQCYSSGLRPCPPGLYGLLCEADLMRSKKAFQRFLDTFDVQCVSPIRLIGGCVIPIRNPHPEQSEIRTDQTGNDEFRQMTPRILRRYLSHITSMHR